MARRLVVLALLVGLTMVWGLHGAAKDQLVIQIWPGSFEEVFIQKVIEPFERLFNADVVTTTGMEWFTLSKLFAEVSSGKPEVDIAQVTVSDFLRGQAMGLWEKLDPDKVTNLRYIPDGFKAEDGVGFETYTMSLVYNKATGKSRPEALEDLWSGEYDLAVDRTHDQYFIPMVNHMLTGHYTPVDIDLVMDKLRELKPYIVTMSESHAEKRILLTNKEIDVSEAFNNRVGLMIDDGLDVEFIMIPEVFVGVDFWGIVKGTEHKDLAQKFINFTLEAMVQEVNAREQYLGPTNTEATLEEQLVLERGIAYGETLGNMTLQDYQYIANNLEAWTTSWQQWIAE
jgi:putative spermidine/putrescine transport system substrate-binding protein